MRSICTLLLALGLFSGCVGSSPNTAPVDSIGLITKAAMEAAKLADTLGPVIERIHFSVAMVDQESRLVDHVPWISIEKTREQLSGLKDPDNIVLPYPQVNLIIDYPVSNPVTVVLENAGEGFSLRSLIAAISDKYHEIYKEEEATANTKTTPIEQRKTLLNRNQTDGKYGIWGHDISDLFLTEIEVYQHNGAIYLKLGIDS